MTSMGSEGRTSIGTKLRTPSMTPPSTTYGLYGHAPNTTHSEERTSIKKKLRTPSKPMYPLQGLNH